MLYLVQHGKSAAKEIDPKKGLTDEGREDTERIAQVAKNYEIKVDKVVHSGKTRAKQSAEIFAEALGKTSRLQEISGIAPMDSVENFAETIDSEANMMVVGHLPFMQRLVSYLTTGDAHIRVYMFQNSGIVCLDRTIAAEDGTFGWYIKWTLNPDIS